MIGVVVKDPFDAVLSQRWQHRHLLCGPVRIDTEVEDLSLWGETGGMEEGQTVSHHVVFVLCRYTLEQANCSSLLGITSVQRSRGLSPSIHLSLSLALASIEYDRSLAI